MGVQKEFGMRIRDQEGDRYRAGIRLRTSRQSPGLDSMRDAQEIMSLSPSNPLLGIICLSF